MFETPHVGPVSVCRVRVVGDPGVGKSSLINRFVSGHFSQVIDSITLCSIVVSRETNLIQFSHRMKLTASLPLTKH